MSNCYGDMVRENENTKVIDCLYHKYKHIFPLPSETQIKKYYQEDKFYQQHSPKNWFKKEQKEKKYWKPYFNYLTSFLNPNFPLIDVGCGAGWFLEHWINNYGIGYGIEPSLMAKNMSPVSEYILPNNSFLKKKYTRKSNVVFSLILEHVVNPIEFITEHLSLLSPNATLMIIVPNDFSPLQNKTSHFINPVHINYFSRDSLIYVITKAIEESGNQDMGFITAATFPMEIFLKIGLDYRNNPQLGQRLHLVRLFFENTFPRKSFQLYHYLFKKYDIGREIILVSRKIPSGINT